MSRTSGAVGPRLRRVRSLSGFGTPTNGYAEDMEHDDRADRRPDLEPGRDGEGLPLERDRSVAEWLERRSGRQAELQSDPPPAWEAHNVVVTATDPRVARHVIRDWERVDAPDRQVADRRVGFVVLGPPDSRGTPSGAHAPSTEGSDSTIARHFLATAAPGLVVGMVIGAVLVGAGAALIMGTVGAVIGGALGGAAFGGPIGAVWSFVRSSGWSSAYRQSFVGGREDSLYVATFHTDDRHAAEFAQLSAAAQEAVVTDVLDVA